ncbi:MAG: ankyrin repeat domain-containing protein [Gammaproteobacteria bacterium]
MNPRIDAPIALTKSEKYISEKELLEMKSLIEASFEKRIRALEQEVQAAKNIINILIGDNNLKTNYKEGYAMLHHAVESGNIQTVRKLIAAKADLDARTCNFHGDGDSALMLAIREGHEMIARELIEAKADINFSNYHKSTPLRLTIWYDRLPILELLLSRGAVVGNKKELVKFLKKCDQKDPYVIAAYHNKQVSEYLASKEGKEESTFCFNLFKSAVAEPKFVESKQDKTQAIAGQQQKALVWHG